MTDVKRIVVCVKQVPVAAAVEFDETTGTLRREGIPSEVSSFDVRALLGALRLRAEEAPEARVTVLTMGPPQAADALRYCLALGADDAVHVCDRAFAGSDTLATARALSDFLQHELPDIVFFGRNSTDSETGHVGPQVAELLGWPQITGVQQLRLIGSGRVRATCQTDEGIELVEAELPLVNTAAEDLADERFPSKEAREAAESREVLRISLEDLGASADRYGFEGSPTVVEGVKVVSESPRERVLLEDEDLETQLQMVQELLESSHGDVKPHGGRPLPQVVGDVTDARILVVAEASGSELRPVSLELLGKAAELAASISAQVEAFVPSGDPDAHAAILGAHGGSTVHVLYDPEVKLDAEGMTHVLGEVIAARRPRIVLFPSTSASRDVAPRVAVRLGAGLTSDCVDLELDESGRLLQHKAAFGDNAVALIRSRTLPEMATVRPGMLEAVEPDWSRTVNVIHLEPEGLPRPRTRIEERVASDNHAVSTLESAETVIAVGTGLGSPDHLPLVYQLAERLGAGIGATRKVADAGWLPRQWQIGLSGRAVSPQIYITLGVRGAYEHIVGMRRSGVVIAVDHDPDAFIFDHADLGIVSDCVAFVEGLLQVLDTATIQTGR